VSSEAYLTGSYPCGYHNRIQICSPWIKQVRNLPMTRLFSIGIHLDIHSWIVSSEVYLTGSYPCGYYNSVEICFSWGWFESYWQYFYGVSDGIIIKDVHYVCCFFSLLLEIALECLYDNALCHSWSIKSGENGAIIRMARRRSKHTGVDTNRPPEHFRQAIYQGFHELMDRQFYT